MGRNKTQQTMQGALSPVAFLLKGIAAIAAHNTTVARLYASKPEAFAGLTDSQRGQCANAAASLGADPAARFRWVHQRYSPLPLPGQERRDALQSLYDKCLAAGLISPKVPFVEYVKNTDGSTTLTGGAVKQALDQGAIVQRGVRGGFAFAIKADLDSAPNKRASKSGKPAPSPATLLQQLQ